MVSTSDITSMVTTSDTASMVSTSDTTSMVSTSDITSMVTTSDTTSMVTTSDTTSMVTTSDTTSMVTTSDTTSMVTTSDTTSMVSTSDTTSMVSTSDTASMVSTSDTTSILSTSDTITVTATTSIVSSAETSVISTTAISGTFINRCPKLVTHLYCCGTQCSRQCTYTQVCSYGLHMHMHAIYAAVPHSYVSTWIRKTHLIQGVPSAYYYLIRKKTSHLSIDTYAICLKYSRYHGYIYIIALGLYLHVCSYHCKSWQLVGTAGHAYLEIS